MEKRVWSACEQSLNSSSSLSRETLASVRSLIVNPYTSDSTISSILETLTRSLQFNTDSLHRQHILKLLSDLASCRTHLSSSILGSVSSNSQPSADSLAAVASITECDQSLRTELNDESFLSLCFGSSPSTRTWLLRNAAERFGVPTHVLLTVFLGFTKDPYPYVRKVALDGLAELPKKCTVFNRSVVGGCYFRAVELLEDSEDCVRLAAVRVVGEWGQMLAETAQEEDRRDWSDVVFVQLCSMVRDMNVDVRVGAFDALGKTKMVSEDVLLQTLSKKVLSIIKEKKSSGRCNAQNCAGAFVHGLEDEFVKVRRSACHSLRMLVVLSSEFAGQALNLLMDILNDHSILVRLEAIETLCRIATFGCLKMQDIHMHMFLGTLFDKNYQIRSAARRIIKLVTLPKLEFFRLCINGLLENLERYPQDEPDVFSTLFYIGKNHGKFAGHIIKEVSQEIEPVGDGRLNFDSARVASFLVLSISAPLAADDNGQSIPPIVFSYAVTLLGRVSNALKDVLDRSTLLEYLSQCSRSSVPCRTEVERESLLHDVDNDVPRHMDMDSSSSVESPLLQRIKEASEFRLTMPYESSNATASLVEYQLEENDGILKSINLVLVKVNDVWPLVLSGFTNEVLKALRACKEELEMFAHASHKSAGALAFALEYVKAIKLLSKIMGCIIGKIWSCGSGYLEILLGKLDVKLREIRCRFIELSVETELCVLELVVVACILRLSAVELCCYQSTYQRLSATLARIEFLHKEESIEPSNFVLEIKKSLDDVGSALNNSPWISSRLTELVNHFSPKQLIILRTLRHVNAELIVHGNEPEDPLPFVPGLPLAIPLEFTLHNVSSSSRLWLSITLSGELTQYVFLDLNLLGGSDEVSKFTFNAPFYRTPKAGSFSLKVCIGLECSFEDAQLIKGRVGPKRPLVYLCQEKEVYLRKV
ncbi:hypothetical protein K2173_008401 [Erythroxylum novogranatense]|uniref:Integrator complex subunit 4/Protein SIEL C-terminal Ig-like domain-containing protein n=1 Tax=Erythroxylum novogranatense TaxID=1862640 RepID=A0AAV8U8Z8_9ROSI|nr:hypothetical protein K2173_008401 [Erythroxylum novogranatense]